MSEIKDRQWASQAELDIAAKALGVSTEVWYDGSTRKIGVDEAEKPSKIITYKNQHYKLRTLHKSMRAPRGVAEVRGGMHNQQEQQEP